MSRIRAGITALAMELPERRVGNVEFEKRLETSDEWIRERTGIRERRLVEKGVANSDLSARVVERILRSRDISAEEIDLIIVGTVTPDMMFPSTACLVQEKVGAHNAWGFDLSGACSGFLYALATGSQFIQTGACSKVVVLGTDIMSSIVDFEDRSTCVLFGDGAGGVLLEPSLNEDAGILDFLLHSDGSGGKFLYMPGGGSRNPTSLETVERKMHFVHQDGRNVFRFAVKFMAEVSNRILERNGLTAKDVALYIPHQANLRIINSAVERLGLSPQQVVVNIDRYANTTAATIPIGLVESFQSGRLRKGDLVLLASFGAGFTWGSVLLRWGLDGRPEEGSPSAN